MDRTSSHVDNIIIRKYKTYKIKKNWIQSPFI